MVNVGKYSSPMDPSWVIRLGVLSCSAKGSPSFLEMVDFQCTFFGTKSNGFMDATWRIIPMDVSS